MKNTTFLITVSETPSLHTRVVLEGSLVINNAAAIKKKLLDTLHSAAVFEVGLHNIVKLDTAVLQLLIAFRKSASILQKKVSFDVEATPYTETIIKKAGLAKMLVTNLKSKVNGIH